MFLIEFNKLLTYKRDITYRSRNDNNNNNSNSNNNKSNYRNSNYTHDQDTEDTHGTPLKKCYIDKNMIKPLNIQQYNVSNRYIEHLNKYIHYIISWSSYNSAGTGASKTNKKLNYYDIDFHFDSNRNEVRSLSDFPYIDGNHPNFVLNSINISMNLMHISNKENATKIYKSKYGVSIINIYQLIADKRNNITNPNTNSYTNTNNNGIDRHVSLYTFNLQYVEEVYPYGTGHPTVFTYPFPSKSNSTPSSSTSSSTSTSAKNSFNSNSNSRYILTDSYMKEYQVLEQQLLYPHLAVDMDLTTSSSSSSSSSVIVSSKNTHDKGGIQGIQGSKGQKAIKDPVLVGLTDDYPLPHRGDTYSNTYTPIRLINIEKQTEVWLGHVTHAHSLSSGPGPGPGPGQTGRVEKYATIFYEYIQKNRLTRPAHSNMNVNKIIGIYVYVTNTLWDMYDWLVAQYYTLLNPRSYYYTHMNHWRCDGHVTLGFTMDVGVGVGVGDESESVLELDVKEDSVDIEISTNIDRSSSRSGSRNGVNQHIQPQLEPVMVYNTVNEGGSQIENRHVVVNNLLIQGLVALE